MININAFIISFSAPDVRLLLLEVAEVADVQPHLDVQLLVLYLDVLVERPLRPVRSLAGLHGAAVVPLD